MAVMTIYDAFVAAISVPGIAYAAYGMQQKLMKEQSTHRTLCNEYGANPNEALLERLVNIDYAVKTKNIDALAEPSLFGHYPIDPKLRLKLYSELTSLPDEKIESLPLLSSYVKGEDSIFYFPEEKVNDLETFK